MSQLKTPPLRLLIITIIAVVLLIQIFVLDSSKTAEISLSRFAMAFFVSVPFVAAFGRRWMQFLLRGGLLAGLSWLAIGGVSNGITTTLLGLGIGILSLLLAVGWFPEREGNEREPNNLPPNIQKVLTTSLVFGIADFVGLALMTFVAFSESSARDPGFGVSGAINYFRGLALGSTIVLGGALAGLYRERVWGLFLCLFMNVFVVSWIWLQGRLAGFIVVLFLSTAIVQLVLGAWMWNTILTPKIPCEKTND